MLSTPALWRQVWTSVAGGPTYESFQGTTSFGNWTELGERVSFRLDATSTLFFRSMRRNVRYADVI